MYVSLCMGLQVKVFVYVCCVYVCMCVCVYVCMYLFCVHENIHNLDGTGKEIWVYDEEGEKVNSIIGA